MMQVPQVLFRRHKFSSSTSFTESSVPARESNERCLCGEITFWDYTDTWTAAGLPELPDITQCDTKEVMDVKVAAFNEVMQHFEEVDAHMTAAIADIERVTRKGVRHLRWLRVCNWIITPFAMTCLLWSLYNLIWWPCPK